MLKQIDARAAHLEKVDAEVREWEKKTSKSAEAELKSRAAQIANDLAQSHADKNFCIAEVPDADGKLLQGVAEALKTKFNGPIFLVGTRDASVALVAYVPKRLTAKFQANKLIQQIAPIVGGKGGGRPESAQGAGKDTSKINEALAKARELLSNSSESLQNDCHSERSEESRMNFCVLGLTEIDQRCFAPLNMTVL